jgi:hypothetical protein
LIMSTYMCGFGLHLSNRIAHVLTSVQSARVGG